MDSSDAGLAGILVILLILSAFFSSSETALMSVSRIRIRSLADEGNERAKIVQRLIEEPSRMLSAILIGNNVVNLSASAIATVLATRIAVRIGMGNQTGRAVGLATGILTILVLIFGEITPKSAAAARAERFSLRAARIILLLTKLLTPIILVVNSLSYAVMRITGVDPHKTNRTMTENDLLTVIDVGHEDGVIESDEKEMITNVIDFGDAEAGEVMIPRIDVEFLDKDSTYEEVLEVCRREKYSRFPVFEGEKDHIVGILNIKDMIFNDITPETFSIEKLMRKPFFIYEFQKVSDLMVQMQNNSVNMAIVLDEYGDVAGIVTMEDLIEEIIGEIRDEYDEEEIDDIRQISPTEYLLDGSTRLDDINDLFDVEFSTEDYDSLAGLIMDELGNIPAEGDEVTASGIHFIVKKMDRNRIETVYAKVPEASKDDKI